MALSAPPVERALLRGWLAAAGYETSTVEEAESIETVRERGVRTLISYYPTAAQTTSAVTRQVLHGLSAAAVWIQLGPMPLEIASGLVAKAHIASVHLLHAPYVTPPTGRPELPLCVAYCTEDHPSADILRALASRIHWAGDLDAHGDVTPPPDN